jgi:hypothetical protein
MGLMFGSELTIPTRKLDGGAGERFFYVYLLAPDADKSTSIGHPLRISLAESPLEVGRFNLLAFRIAENRQGRMLPVLAQMMRPMRQPVVVAD